MKKVLAILLSVLMIASFAACGGGTDKPSAGGSKPEISGVHDMTVEAGQSFDALDGVSASDTEDGDLTAMITIDASPALSFKGGKATPENAGSYELVYSVTDSSGETAEAYATLTVTKKTGEAVLLKDFDFSTVEATDAKGWEAFIAEDAKATAAMKDGAFVFDVENPGEGDDRVMFVKKNFGLKAGADYKVQIWAKSTVPTYAHLIAKNELVEDWQTFGGAWNLRVEEAIHPLEITFTAPEDGSAELRLHLGKITPNPDNPADTTPENFTVTIDKVQIYEITGEEHLVPVYTADFTDSGAFINAGDGAFAYATFENGEAVYTIETYPTDGGVWSIQANLELPGITVEQGVKYNYSFTAVAENAQSGEALVESATRFHEARANFNGIFLPAGEEVTISSQFVAEASVEDPVIRMQIGNASEGVTTNKLTIKNFVFNKVGGDKETKKTIEDFAPFGMRAAENVDKEQYPWETFNGTDEDNEHGVGTIWTSDGSLFYRIDDGGTVDWHNKLICPITLPGDSYFTVEITVKATKDVSCGFFLNPQGGWDPRVSEGLDITTEEKTFTFETNDTFIMDMACELLFQFGSEATAALGEVTIEFTSIKIYQRSVL